MHESAAALTQTAGMLIKSRVRKRVSKTYCSISRTTSSLCLHRVMSWSAGCDRTTTAVFVLGMMIVCRCVFSWKGITQSPLLTDLLKVDMVGCLPESVVNEVTSDSLLYPNRTTSCVHGRR